VTTTVANCMILRIGGFQHSYVTVDVPGLSGHTAIIMDQTGSGHGGSSGGAAYQHQPTAGESSTPEFGLTYSEEYVTLSVAIAPSTGGGSGSGPVSGGGGYVMQSNSGSSGTSLFSLTDSEEARMVTLAVAPDPTIGSSSGDLVISKQTPY